MTAVLYGCSYRLRKHRWPQATPNGHRIRYHMSFARVYFGWLTLKSYPSNAVRTHRHIIVFWWAELMDISDEMIQWYNDATIIRWLLTIFNLRYGLKKPSLSGWICGAAVQPFCHTLETYFLRYDESQSYYLFVCLSWCLSTLWALRKLVAEMAVFGRIGSGKVAMDCGKSSSLPLTWRTYRFWQNYIWERT